MGIFDSDHLPLPRSFEMAWRDLSSGSDVVQGRTKINPKYVEDTLSKIIAGEFEVCARDSQRQHQCCPPAASRCLPPALPPCRQPRSLAAPGAGIGHAQTAGSWCAEMWWTLSELAGRVPSGERAVDAPAPPCTADLTRALTVWRRRRRSPGRCVMA